MDFDYTRMPLDDLEAIQIKADAEFKKALLQGAPWEDLRARKDLVIFLNTVIHKRRYPLGDRDTPADSALR